MKKFAKMMVAALMVLSFSAVVMAEETKDAKAPAATKKADKKAAKKVKKDLKKAADAKPAAKGKKEVSGC